MAESRELLYLRRIYLKAERDILNEINRLRSEALVDYHAVAALARIRKILQKLVSDSWDYVPRMLERYFYILKPKAYIKVPKTAAEHLIGYMNAEALTSEETDIVQRLTMSAMADLEDASNQAAETLESYLVGRRDDDVFRQVGLQNTAELQAMGTGINSRNDFIRDLMEKGVTCFVDKAGRRWNLSTYSSMVLRSTSRQAEILSVLLKDPEQDLYKITAHGTTCGLCAPYEGRVYSKSGTDPVFPPLADAFGKIDPAGPNDLTNTWLTIHPNCLHSIVPWSPMGRTDEEVRKIIAFSSPKTNPYSRDPRSEAQILAYNRKQAARARFLENKRQFERYRASGIEGFPKTFETFMKHKTLNDEKYQGWLTAYRKRNKLN